MFFKLCTIKITGKELFGMFMAGFQAGVEVCQLCGSKGHCAIFGHYNRNLIDCCLGVIKYDTIVVTRVKCAICNHTHAILPDLIIPYSTYSLVFILRVIGAYLNHQNTVEALCEKYGISHCMLYRWLGLYNAHKGLWLGALKSIETNGKTFLSNIMTMPKATDFTSGFFALSSYSFLQSHANPAHTRRRPRSQMR